MRGGDGVLCRIIPVRLVGVVAADCESESNVFTWLLKRLSGIAKGKASSASSGIMSDRHYLPWAKIVRSLLRTSQSPRSRAYGNPMEKFHFAYVGPTDRRGRLRPVLSRQASRRGRCQLLRRTGTDQPGR